MNYVINYKIHLVLQLFILFIFVYPVSADIDDIIHQNTLTDSLTPADVPVLLFHIVDSSLIDKSRYTLTPMMFEKIIEELLYARYHFLSTQEYLDYIIHGVELPEKSVLLTFDDGYSSFYHNVYPLLKKHSIHACMYLITSRINESLYPSPEYLSPEQIKEMYDSGLVDFQSHTHNLHNYLNNEPAILKQKYETDEQYQDRIIDDFKKSVDLIVDITGENVISLALPYGVGNDIIENLAEEAGFYAVFYAGVDENNSYRNNPFHLNRIGVYRFNEKVISKLVICNYFSKYANVDKKASVFTEIQKPFETRVRFSTNITNSIIYSSPAVGDDGTVYVGSWDNDLYALNPDGTLKWKYSTSGGISSSPAIVSDGTIYVGSYLRYIHAVNPDGSYKWKYDAGCPILSSPAVDGSGTIYVTATNSCIYALNPNGSRKWIFQAGDTINSSPSVDKNGTIYFGSWDTNFYALNSDGSLQWKYRTDEGIESSPAIDTDGTIYIGSMDSCVYAVHPDGSLKWKYKTDGWIDSSPAIGIDSIIYIGSWDAHLYAINSCGTLEWKFKTGGRIDSSPIIGIDGTIYIGSWDGYLYAVNPDGSEKWREFIGEGICSSPSLSKNGMIYTGSIDSNFLYIDSGTNAGLAESPWPKFLCNRYNTSYSPGITSVQTELINPGDFMVFAPYPNPFNASVTIRYFLPVDSPVELIIYDILGRKVTSLQNGITEAGYHEITWNGRCNSGTEAGTGVYLYQLKAGSFYNHGKITFMK